MEELESKLGPASREEMPELFQQFAAGLEEVADEYESTDVPGELAPQLRRLVQVVRLLAIDVEFRVSGMESALEFGYPQRVDQRVSEVTAQFAESADELSEAIDKLNEQLVQP